jgi:hypothetical protein
MKAVILPILFLCLLFSCKKDTFITSPDARLRLTADTLHFDTVFTTVGSITQSFKIINENDQRLLISSIVLKGGSASAFRVNADGIPGPAISDIEIKANDSIYVFVSVKVDPGAASLPFIIRDSIEINYNGAKQLLQLEAWGQNAHFMRDKEVNGNETWINDLPYVILGYLYIDTNATLTIDKGARIFVHADAPIIVDGSLQVNGQPDTADRVYFRGDRMDEPYKNFPAAWPGIYFRAPSHDNVLNYAVISNSYQGLAAEDPSPNANPKLILNQCIIDNAYETGIIAVNSSITANNCLVSNCGRNLYLVKGGNYQFNHCTVASYSNPFIFHRNPVLYVSNFINVNNTPVIQPLDALFRNCIFWGENGNVDNEVIVDRSGGGAFSVVFDHGLMKVQANPGNSTLTQVIFNQSPQFDSINTSDRFYSFRLKPGSPAVDKATPTGLVFDLDGRPRVSGLMPDLGAYEQ